MERSRRNVVCRLTWILMILMGLFRSVATAQTSTAQQEADAFGYAVDRQMAALRDAIASGEQEKVKAHLQMVFPLLRAEKDAKLKAYVQGAQTGQVRRGHGSADESRMIGEPFLPPYPAVHWRCPHAETMHLVRRRPAVRQISR